MPYSLFAMVVQRFVSPQMLLRAVLIYRTLNWSSMPPFRKMPKRSCIEVGVLVVRGAKVLVFSSSLMQGASAPNGCSVPLKSKPSGPYPLPPTMCLAAIMSVYWRVLP